MRHVFPLLIVASLFVGPAVLADSALPGPSDAVSFRIESGDAYVAWLPPTGAPASSYRVYGYGEDGTRERLTETPLLAAVVPGGYHTYAVVAVYGLSESPEEIAETCVEISPPSVDVPPSTPSISQDCV